MLDPIENGRLDLGARQVEGMKPDNLARLYETLYEIIPDAFLDGLPEPGGLRASTSRPRASCW